jgi:cytochrome c biogenesis protein CcdA
MTTRQELRLWGFISLVGSAVGSIVFTDVMWLRVVGIMLLYFTGLFLSSNLALKMADKRDARDAAKAAELMQKTEGVK